RVTDGQCTEVMYGASSPARQYTSSARNDSWQRKAASEMAFAHSSGPRHRLLVTGGNGFLGRHVLAVLAEREYGAVVAPRKADYDLTQAEQVAACLRDVRPDAIVHLAAVVGGIGANRERPGEFFYQNLIMGTTLMEQARAQGVRKFVAIGTIC